MRIDIDETTSSVINELVQSKQFDNPMHVIQYAVHQLKLQSDPLMGWEEEELREEIQKGMDDANAGRMIDGKEVFRQLRQRIQNEC